MVGPMAVCLEGSRAATMVWSSAGSKDETMAGYLVGRSASKKVGTMAVYSAKTTAGKSDGSMVGLRVGLMAGY